MTEKSSNKAVVVTGVAGEIGFEIAKVLDSCGYHIIGIDRNKPVSSNFIGDFIQSDFTKIISDSIFRFNLNSKLDELTFDKQVVGLVNNAAKQVVSPFLELTENDLFESFAVNAVAPVLLTSILFEQLKRSHGSVVNIGSIHSGLTKAGFAAYAASKAAMASFARSAAIEMGSSVRVNTIVPAAIDTAMLRSGFEGDETLMSELKNFHPSGGIGTPSEVAELVRFLIQSEINFLNGASIEIDGGISSVLHDPSQK